MTSLEKTYPMHKDLFEILGQRLIEATLAYARSENKIDYMNMMNWQDTLWRYAQEIAKLEQEKQNLS
jgi:hypothetical protein